MANIRTFIAFDTPEQIKKEMGVVQSELKKSNAEVKWEDENKFHVTVKFLGDIEENTLPSVITKIESIVHTHSRFDVYYKGIGSFPNNKNPRVIWIGCGNNDGRLELFKTSLDVGLLSFGFEEEKRKFHPHITLGRVKSLKGVKNLTPMLEKLTFDSHVTKINEILVMKSILRPEGSEYSLLKAIKLQQ
jgi:2'-5' RNA ligase